MLTKIDEKPSESLPLVLRHGHDAGHVVLLLAMLLFGKVAHQMAALLVVLGEHVEEERLHVVVERFVVQKQLSQQTQILAVDLVHVPINFENGQVLTSVDFRGRRMAPRALVLMPLQNRFALRVFQAELAQEQLR